MTHHNLVAGYHSNSTQYKQYEQCKPLELSKKKQPYNAILYAMNICVRPQRLMIIRIVYIILAFTGFLSSAPVYSDATNILEVSNSPHILINEFKTSDTIQNTGQVKTRPTRKKVMIDESRDLSAFFIFGIAINVIMAITFAWWFTREWRKSKK